jgi:hypothetical protein
MQYARGAEVSVDTIANRLLPSTIPSAKENEKDVPPCIRMKMSCPAPRDLGQRHHQNLQPQLARVRMISSQNEQLSTGHLGHARHAG